ncbi:MAG: carbohydrate ABC transporter permease [Synergistetes bacterium]|nr:carbohydrate ABC transporter permease [Synergistota bacterium]
MNEYKLTFWQMKKEKITKAIIITILIVITLPIILTYTWLVLASFSTDMKYGIIPVKLTLHNWRFLWKSIEGYPPIWQVFFNTLILALSVMGLEVFATILGGYALSRFKFRMRETLLKIVLVIHAFPSISLLVAIYYILKITGLIDTLTGVILLKASLEIPWGIWIMKGFYDQIPWEVEFAGLVDGYSRVQVWRKVILPLVKPGIAVAGIFSFLSGWSEFVFINTFILSQNTWTLSTYVKAIIGDFRFVDYGLLTSISLFYIIPTIIFFIFANKYLLRVNITGTKG